MNLNINFGIPSISIITISIILLAFILNKKFDLFNTWIMLIKKYPLVFLILFPPIATYIFICGAISALAFGLYFKIRPFENFMESEFLLMENSIEYICSFVMPFIYFLILKKNDFPFFWIFLITVMHMVFAGYRDPKLITNSSGNPESGPIILESFEFFDALFPLLSLLLFLFLFRTELAKNLNLSH